MTPVQSQSQFSLPPLPYPENALEPILSARTLSFHYGKHHRNYVDTLNQLCANTEYAGMQIEDIIRKTVDNRDKATIFNNAAQVWNHTFYWNCMKPKAGGAPSGRIVELIKSSFGSFEQFKTSFIDAAVKQFGSGYAWLVADGASLKIVSSANAINPLTQRLKPILAIDVWEHAYYLEYQNRRKDYVQAFVDSLLNWDFANKNLQ